MVKTTVYLPDHTKDRLAAVALRRHTSEAELIREAVERLLREDAPDRRPRFGIFGSGDPTFAAQADEALAEGFGQNGVDW